MAARMALALVVITWLAVMSVAIRVASAVPLGSEEPQLPAWAKRRYSSELAVNAPVSVGVNRTVRFAVPGHSARLISGSEMVSAVVCARASDGATSRTASARVPIRAPILQGGGHAGKGRMGHKCRCQRTFPRRRAPSPPARPAAGDFLAKSGVAPPPP